MFADMVCSTWAAMVAGCASAAAWVSVIGCSVDCVRTIVPTTGAISATAPAMVDTALEIALGEVKPKAAPIFGNNATRAAMKVVIKPRVCGLLYHGIAALILPLCRSRI